MTTQQHYFYGLGRRKASVARIRLYPGGGAVIINGKPMEEVLPRPAARQEMLRPLAATDQVRRRHELRVRDVVDRAVDATDRVGVERLRARSKRPRRADADRTDGTRRRIDAQLRVVAADGLRRAPRAVRRPAAGGVAAR